MSIFKKAAHWVGHAVTDTVDWVGNHPWAAAGLSVVNPIWGAQLIGGALGVKAFKDAKADLSGNAADLFKNIKKPNTDLDMDALLTASMQQMRVQKARSGIGETFLTGPSGAAAPVTAQKSVLGS